MSHDVLAFPRRRLVSAGGRSTYPAGITSTPMAVMWRMPFAPSVALAAAIRSRNLGPGSCCVRANFKTALAREGACLNDQHNEGGLHVSIRSALVTVVAALPASELKNSLLRRLGWAIGDGVYIGPCLIFNVDHVDIGGGARIGYFNVVRDLASLTVGEHADIGQWTG